MATLTVNDLDVRDKRVLVRVDYNVPIEEKDGKIVVNDATRIKETLPTLELLIKKGAKIILAAARLGDVGSAGFVAGRIYARDPGVLGSAGRGDLDGRIQPMSAGVAGHLHLSVVRAGPYHAGLRG